KASELQPRTALRAGLDAERARPFVARPFRSFLAPRPSPRAGRPPCDIAHDLHGLVLPPLVCRQFLPGMALSGACGRANGCSKEIATCVDGQRVVVWWG